VLHAALFGTKHRLGRPWLGSPVTLARIQASDLHKFHRDRITPNHAVLVIAGDLSAAAIDAQATAELESWDGWAPGNHIDETLGAEPRRPVSLLEMPEYQQIHVMAGFVVPGPTDRSWPALVAAVYYLGGAQLALLDLALRERHGYSFGFRAAAKPVPGAAIVSVKGFVAATTAHLACRRLLDVLSQFRQIGCPIGERDKVIGSLRAAAPIQLQTAPAVGNAYAEAAIRRLPREYPRNLHDALRHVSAEEIGRVAADLLSPARRALVLSGPAGQIEAAAAEFSDVTTA
jgi:predicted Zn-dependent peptidase